MTTCKKNYDPNAMLNAYAKWRLGSESSVGDCTTFITDRQVNLL